MYFFQKDEAMHWFKRFMDVLVSLLALIILCPIFLLIAVLIKLTSKGQIFYRWKVVGLNYRFFTGYKFRTMISNADEVKATILHKNEMTGPVFKCNDDPRVTRVGSFLRKYSLDELPQLWSVLKGDMSLVGPHPPLQTEFEKFENWQKRKLSVKPGITCFWQIKGRHKIRNFNNWVKMDLYYIDNWSLWLDFKILIKTVIVVFKGTGV
jgi:lipopolysaccharide/colanic/teichoic acid biosynthesis glycosyltransferase